MKFVISAFLFSFLVAIAFLSVKTIPKISSYTNCYRQTNELYNKAGSLTRAGHMSQNESCAADKPAIIAAGICYKAADKTVEASEKERQLIKTIAQKMARNTKTIEEVIRDHNQVCTTRKLLIDPVVDIRLSR